MSDTTIIEINGTKLEVDLTEAKRIENIRVGSKVKVLRKEYSGHKVDHGVVIGFEPFEKLPTIVIATMKLSFSEAKLEFLYYNSETEDVEVIIARNNDEHELDRIDVVESIDRAIESKKAEIAEMEARKTYFLDKFSAYWSPVEEKKEA